MTDDIFPHVKVFRHPDRVHLIMWCSHCRDYHLHGVSDMVDGTFNHRVEHCYKPDTPYTKGYILVDAGPATNEMMRDFRKKGRRRGPADGVSW